MRQAFRNETCLMKIPNTIKNAIGMQSKNTQRYHKKLDYITIVDQTLDGQLEW